MMSFNLTFSPPALQQRLCPEWSWSQQGTETFEYEMMKICFSSPLCFITFLWLLQSKVADGCGRPLAVSSLVSLCSFLFLSFWSLDSLNHKMSLFGKAWTGFEALNNQFSVFGETVIASLNPNHCSYSKCFLFPPRSRPVCILRKTGCKL